MKDKLARLLDNRRFYLVFSILAAFLYWLILSLSDDSNIEKTIYDVPVQLNYNASVYQSFGLEIIGSESMTVDVTVEGPRSSVGKLTANDFLIYPNVNSVTTVGTKELRLVYTNINSTAKYTITGLSQYTVSLRFDKIITQQFPVTIDQSGIEVADGYLLSDSHATPAEISVTGPSTEIGSIAKVKASLSGMVEGEKLNESKIVQGEISLLDADGNEVDRTLLTLDNDRVEINIPILRKAVQPLKIQFINVPQGFDTSTLGCTLDHSSINVAVPTTYSEKLDDYVVGYIDFSELDYQGSYTFQVELPSDYINLDNVQNVTASFATQNYTSKLVTVENIRTVNVPTGLDLTVGTKAIYNVLLVGPPDAIELLDTLEKEKVLDEYIVAQIDAGKVSILSGQQTVSVQILLPSISNVFASGTYTAVIGVG